MKTIALSLALLAGCGSLLNEDKETITITAPDDLKLMLDGMPVVAGNTEVNAHKRHTVTAFDKSGNIVGTCEIDTQLGVGYAVADVVLGLLPVAVDAVTGGWYSLDRTTCAF